MPWIDDICLLWQSKFHEPYLSVYHLQLALPKAIKKNLKCLYPSAATHKVIVGKAFSDFSVNYLLRCKWIYLFGTYTDTMALLTCFQNGNPKSFRFLLLTVRLFNSFLINWFFLTNAGSYPPPPPPPPGLVTYWKWLISYHSIRII